jgi:hypothetical protein
MASRWGISSGGSRSMGRIGLHGAGSGCPPLFSLTAASGDANPGELPPPALGWPAPRFARLTGPPC